MQNLDIFHGNDQSNFPKSKKITKNNNSNNTKAKIILEEKDEKQYHPSNFFEDTNYDGDTLFQQDDDIIYLFDDDTDNLTNENNNNNTCSNNVYQKPIKNNFHTMGFPNNSKMILEQHNTENSESDYKNLENFIDNLDQEGPNPSDQNFESKVAQANRSKGKDEDDLPDKKTYKTQYIQHKGLQTSLKLDSEKSKKWVYIRGKQFRRYQFDITESCLFNNTIVSVPTGLGKTFIATNIILNYYLWFPKGKIFFLAPTRPLIKQQLKSLQNIKRITKTDIQEISGEIAENKRAPIYRNSSIFFATPQTIQNDLIKNKIINKKEIILLVIDEAHKTTGDFAYNKILKEIFDQEPKSGVRVIGLSATPGSEEKRIQELIRNLRTSRLEHRNDTDLGVSKFIKGTTELEITCQQNNSIHSFVEYIDSAMAFMVMRLKEL